MKLINLVGQKFHRLVVKEFSHANKHGKALWLCQCDCGNTATVQGAYLRDGRTKSCGCWNIETIIKRNTRHNMSGTPTYCSWQDMIRRCEDTKNIRYSRYGGRGIKVCERWHKFENFFADMGKKPTDRTLDRVNNNGNYELSNCRWATSKEQANNKSNNRRL